MPAEHSLDMSEGWIKLHRKLLENPLFRNPRHLSVWIYLLLNATHKPVKSYFKGQEIELKPGQLITGRFAGADKTGVAPATFARVLTLFCKAKQIEQQMSNKSTLVSILNWEKHQCCEQQMSTKRATDEHIQEEEEVKNKEVTISRARAGTDYSANPPTLKDCLTVAEMGLAMTKESVELYFNDRTRKGWMIKPDMPVRDLRSDMAYWKSNESNFNRTPLNGQKSNGESTTAKSIRLQSQIKMWRDQLETAERYIGYGSDEEQRQNKIERRRLEAEIAAAEQEFGALK